MRIEKEKLTGLALRTLEEAAAHSRQGPVQRTFGLRLALAYLASTKNCERWPFDGFWQYVAHHDPNGRHANVTANLNGIYEQLGVRRQSIKCDIRSN